MVSPCFQVPILYELKTKQSKKDEVDTQYDIIKVEEYKKAKKNLHLPLYTPYRSDAFKDSIRRGDPNGCTNLEQSFGQRRM